jgi:hypothetical protein
MAASSYGTSVDYASPPKSIDIIAWQVQASNGVSTELLYTSVSTNQMDKILKKAVSGCPEVSLSINLSSRISISNTIWLQDMAEKHGITNITLRLNQTRPPKPPDKFNGFKD